MAYTKQVWADSPATTTPLSAARMSYMENGIELAHNLAGGSTPAHTFTGWANVVVDYGADPSGGAECSAAFRNAYNSGLPIYVPPGAYNYNGAPIGPAGNVFRVFGSGSYQSSINLGNGVRFVDSNGPIYNARVEGLRVNGGAGFFRTTYTGVNVHEFKAIEDCRFFGYTNCCIECNASDSPYWNIHRDIFYGANFTSSMGIGLSGFNDSNSIRNCAFLQNRVSCKMQTGVTAKVIECDFLRFGGSQGFPRVDFWLVPTTTSDPNAGQGFVMAFSKFGNENLDPTDFRILFADQGAGTLFGDRFPITNVASAGALFSQQYTCLNNSGGSGEDTVALITSMTPNITGMCIGPVCQSGIGFQPLLRIFNGSGFNPATNIVGPLHGPSVNQASMGNLVVATTGSISSQPRSL